ncbi:MAG: TIGR03905 family TSCPD domain-containing protein [Eggerthella lenta]
MYRYTPRGVCSRAIDIDLDGDKVARVEFVGGCDGNLKAVSKLIEGMTVEDVAAALEGNTCGRRATSCADQLVKGLREARQAPCRRIARHWPSTVESQAFPVRSGLLGSRTSRQLVRRCLRAR